MQSDKFEKAFGDFLERREYDEAQSAMFTLTRKSFEAGWGAAGGAQLPPQDLFELKPGKVVKRKPNDNQNGGESPTE